MGKTLVRFKGERVERGKPIIDAKGREWDLSVLRAFNYVFIRDEAGLVEGLKLKRMLVCGDMWPVVKEAKKRGLI